MQLILGYIYNHLHQAKIGNNWLDEAGTDRMNWPANSFDDNLIEHACGMYWVD